MSWSICPYITLVFAYPTIITGVPESSLDGTAEYRTSAALKTRQISGYVGSELFLRRAWQACELEEGHVWIGCILTLAQPLSPVNSFILTGEKSRTAHLILARRFTDTVSDRQGQYVGHWLNLAYSFIDTVDRLVSRLGE